MPTYLADDIFECRVEGQTASGTRWNNVLHYRLRADTETNMWEVAFELAQTVYTQYAAAFTASMVAEANILSCRASAIYPQTGVPAVYISPTPIPGDLLAGGLPPDVAVVITKRTDKPGRTFLGRMYLGNIGSEIVTDDLLDESPASSLANSAETFLADSLTLSTAEVFDPVVASQKLIDALTVAADAVAVTQKIEVDRVTRNLTGRGLKYRVPVAGDEGGP